MHLACSNGHDKVVQVLLDHCVQVDIQDKVSNILFVHFKLSSTTEFNNVTMVIKTQMNLIICLSYYNTFVDVVVFGIQFIFALILYFLKFYLYSLTLPQMQC